MKTIEIAKQPYSKISDAVTYKLLNDYKDNLISVDEFRKISRSLTTVFDYLEYSIHGADKNE